MTFGRTISGEAVLQDSGRPNIIVIFTDDQTYRAIGYNNPAIKTPHLDALAASGVTFEREYVASPICAASRASMMTGLFPQQHGVIALNTAGFAKYRNDSPDAKQLLPDRLGKAGYLTAFYGKSHLGDPKSYGFDVGEELPGHNDATTFKKASEFIESRKGLTQPFFLWLAPRQPHVPLLPEQKWLDLYPSSAIWTIRLASLRSSSAKPVCWTIPLCSISPTTGITWALMVSVTRLLCMRSRCACRCLLLVQVSHPGKPLAALLLLSIFIQQCSIWRMPCPTARGHGEINSSAA